MHRLGTALAAIAPGVALLGIWWLFRRREDFARGFLIGTCVIALVGGLCNASVTHGMLTGWR